MIPPWLQNAFDRCGACCLDNDDDRIRLAEAILGSLPMEAISEAVAGYTRATALQAGRDAAVQMALTMATR